MSALIMTEHYDLDLVYCLIGTFVFSPFPHSSARKAGVENNSVSLLNFRVYKKKGNFGKIKEN